VIDTTVYVSGTSASFGAGENTVLTFTNPGTWAAGAYTARLTVTDNDGLTGNKTISLNVAGTTTATTPLSESTTLSIGGFNSSAASFIGLDPVTTYKSSQTSANVSSIDLVFDANTDGSGEVLESPYYAYNTSKDLTSDYWKTGARATYITKVSSAPTTLEDAEAVTFSAQTVAVTSNGIYVAKTQGNVYAVIKFGTISGTGDDATASVTVLEK